MKIIKISLDLYSIYVVYYRVMRVNKIKDMTMTLENKVMNFKYEMEATGSIDGAVDLMKEVRNSGFDDSVKLIRIISDSVKRVVNTDNETSVYDTNMILYNNGAVKKRKVSYRAKYPLILNGGGVGTSRTTRL